jgi:hypothetical protein
MAAAATSVDKIVSRDHHTLFRTFLEIYLENISNSFTTSKQGNQDPTALQSNEVNNLSKNNGNRNRNKTKKNNNISKKVYDRFVELVSNLYKKFYSDSDPDSDSKSINDILNTFFSDYYKTIKNYYDNIKPKENSVQRCYYLNCHGIMKKEISIVPDNVVLIFLTPINRYGICNYWNNTFLTEFFNKNLIKFQQNFSCIDKIKIWYDFNNRYSNGGHRGHELFTNSIFFLPGQKFYDLDLQYNKYDLAINNMGSFMFPVAGTENKEKYGDTFKQVLSVYISEKAKIDPDKIKYIIVNCCRNIDDSIQRNKNNSNATLDFYNDAYIYENILHYYNIIMLGNFTNIGSDIQQKTAGYKQFLSGTITKKKLVDEHMQELKDLFKKNLFEYIKLFKPEKTVNSSGIVDPDILKLSIINDFISKSFDKLKIFYREELNALDLNIFIREDDIRTYIFRILSITVSDLTRKLENVSPKLQNFKNTKRPYRLGHVGRRFLETKLRSIFDGSYKASPKILPIVDQLLVDIREFIH